MMKLFLTAKSNSKLTDLSPMFWIVQTNMAFSPWMAVTLPGLSSSLILVVVAALNNDI